MFAYMPHTPYAERQSTRDTSLLLFLQTHTPMHITLQAYSCAFAHWVSSAILNLSYKYGSCVHPSTNGVASEMPKIYAAASNLICKINVFVCVFSSHFVDSQRRYMHAFSEYRIQCSKHFTILSLIHLFSNLHA